MIILHPIITRPAKPTIRSTCGKASECFVALHPFILTKQGHEQLISFENYYKRPQKSDIMEHCKPLSWTQFILIAGLRDIPSLARCIIFLERGRRFAERGEYLKMCATLDTRPDIMTPPVDWIPEQWENDLGEYLLSKNQFHLEIDLHGLESRTFETKRLLDKQSAIKGPYSHIRTPDRALELYQEIDQPYTFIFGKQHIIAELIEFLDLEGFYANEQTPVEWSHVEIPIKKRMDWDEDMKRLGRTD